MRVLTLSGVGLFCMTQVVGGNRGMMWPWGIGNLSRGQVGLLQETIKDVWIYNFPGAVILPDPLFFFCWIIEVPLL